LTNIWAGVGARLWAVSEKQAANESIRGKARSLPVGALGLFYCVGTRAITTPFLILSRADQERVVKNVWHEPWALPFRISPIATPDKALPVSGLINMLPRLRRENISWNRVLYVSPITAFAASVLTDTEWSDITSAIS
jgi:hypothetical protein